MEVLLVIQVITVVALIAVILVQKSSSDGFTGGGSANSFMTGRASANLFTRITSVLAAIFIANSLVLAYIASHSERASSVLDKAVEESAQENKNKPAATKGSLTDLQKKMNEMNPTSKPSGKTEKPAEGTKTEEKTEEKPAEQKPQDQKPASPTVPVSE